MEHIPVPSKMKDVHNGTIRVFGPPLGAEDSVQPADILVCIKKEGPVLRAYFKLEPDELNLIQLGDYIIELSIWADHLHPFGAQVYNES